MKAFSDIEQSKKLAEILPHDSADGTWKRIVIAGCNLDVPEEQQYFHDGDMPFMYYSGVGIPSWSLATLVDILPEVINFDDDENDYAIEIIKEDGLYYLRYGNPFKDKIIEVEPQQNFVDTCVAMIEKLHEQNFCDYGYIRKEI